MPDSERLLGDAGSRPENSCVTVIVTNVTIATGDAKRPWVTGAAFADDYLVGMGSAAEMQKLRTAATHIFDAAGETVILPPGITVGSRARVVTDSAARIVILSGEGEGA